MRVAFLSLILLGGCGELTGATEYTDAAFAPREDTAPRDTSPRDTSVDAAGRDASAVNDLMGDYHGNPLGPTRGAFRLTTLGNPRLVFVSDVDEATIPCEFFKASDWQQRLPASAVVHMIELTGTAAGIHNDVSAGRTERTEAPVALERARSATVILTRYDVGGATGTFDLMFDFVDPDVEGPDAGIYPEPVRGTFDVATCAVDW